jgi:hypothetical protein
VLSASYNLGAGWVAITPLPTIEPDPSLEKFGCTSGDVFKFDQGTTGSAITQYRIVMNGHWGTGDMTVFFKSGTNTGCCSKTITGGGIGCPEDESCSFSQGYWFANNDMHPEGVHPWTTTVTIGGLYLHQCRRPCNMECAQHQWHQGCQKSLYPAGCHPPERCRRNRPCPGSCSSYH